MTEATNAPEFTTVREHRHLVRTLLSEASNRFGSAAHKLRGETGLTQPQQVERFEQAAERVSEGTDLVGQASQAVEAGKDYAATRDFEAHQAAKAARTEIPAVRPQEPESDEL